MYMRCFFETTSTLDKSLICTLWRSNPLKNIYLRLVVFVPVCKHWNYYILTRAPEWRNTDADMQDAWFGRQILEVRCFDEDGGLRVRTGLGGIPRKWNLSTAWTLRWGLGGGVTGMPRIIRGLEPGSGASSCESRGFCRAPWLCVRRAWHHQQHILIHVNANGAGKF